MTDTAARHDLTPMHEIEIDVQRRGRHEKLTGHISGAVMRAAVLIFAGIRVSDTGSECRLSCEIRRRKNRNGEKKKEIVSPHHSRKSLLEDVREATFHDSGTLQSGNCQRQEKTAMDIKK